MLNKLTFIVIAVVLFATPYPAQAVGRLLNNYTKWAAYIDSTAQNTICFMSSEPDKDTGNYSQRGQIYAYITHNKNQKTRDIVSFIAGYTYAPQSSVTVTIDNRYNFTLFTDGDTAWTSSAVEDHRLTSAIVNGETMVVRGTSNRGTVTTDTYSLSGSSAAYNAINNACR